MKSRQQPKGGLASKHQSQLELPVIGKKLLGDNADEGMAGECSLIVFTGGKSEFYSLTISLIRYSWRSLLLSVLFQLFKLLECISLFRMPSKCRRLDA